MTNISLKEKLIKEIRTYGEQVDPQGYDDGDHNATADAIIQVVIDSLPKKRPSVVKTSKAFQKNFKKTELPIEFNIGFNLAIDDVTEILEGE